MELPYLLRFFSGSIYCFISIEDNGYSVLITNNSQINENKKAMTIKGKMFCFDKFQLILLCLFVPKIKKAVIKYVICYSTNCDLLVLIILAKIIGHQNIFINVHTAKILL